MHNNFYHIKTFYIKQYMFRSIRAIIRSKYLHSYERDLFLTIFLYYSAIILLKFHLA